MKLKVTTVGIIGTLLGSAAIAQTAPEMSVPPPPENVEQIMPATQPAPAESLSPPAPQPSAADVFVGSVPENPVLARGYLSPLNDWNTSVMFTPSVMRKLRQVVEVYEKNRNLFATGSGGDDSGIDVLQWDAGKVQGPVFPSFFLASIVYYKADDWSVWIDGKKITAESNDKTSDLYVESINKKTARLSWRPLSLDKVLSVWDPVQVDAYSENQTGDIVVDRSNGVITFELRPNQTFSSSLSKVVEGKSSPVISVSGEGELNYDTTARPKVAAKDERLINGMPESQTGIKDPMTISQELIEQYKKIGKLVPKKN